MKKQPQVEDDILSAISDKGNKRNEIVDYYMGLIYWQDLYDVPKVNKAIIKRWSRSGLIYIKTKAHQQLKDITEAGGRK